MIVPLRCRRIGRRPTRLLALPWRAEPVVVRVSRSDDFPGAPLTAADSPASMRHSFQRVEQSLYAELSRTPIALLNDARWTFQAARRGAQKRIAAWEKKHLQDLIGDLSADWWDKKCHALRFMKRTNSYFLGTLGPCPDGAS